MNVRRRVLEVLVFALLCAGAASAQADRPPETDAAPAAALRAKYIELKEQLGRNQFQQPLTLVSRESPGEVTGEIHAVVNSPFATTGIALSTPGDWCDIMTLHINTKVCKVSADRQGPLLEMWIGMKHDQPLADTSRLGFVYRVHARTANYLRVQLSAVEGPMGTRDYRIVLEGIPLTNGQTFIRLAYSYSYDLFGRLAMQTYLATIGRNKVGFTLLGPQAQDAADPPRHIGGIRGVVERNTMRYYLAIEAFLGALSMPREARFERRIRDWFAASERYPRQLREVEQSEYLDMKRKDNLLQQAAPA